MNIDELKETRDTFAVWGYETLLSDELIEKIISILDAEIARQSVTDEDVKRAIEYLNTSCVTGCEDDLPEWFNSIVTDSLRAYQPWVTDEDVKDAIEHIRIIKTNHGLQKDEYQSLDLAITALQQMRTEGWKSVEDESLEEYDEGDVLTYDLKGLVEAFEACRIKGWNNRHPEQKITYWMPLPNPPKESR